MINLEFVDDNGQTVDMAYDVHPGSQGVPIRIPTGVAGVSIWLGTRPAGG